MTLDRAAIGSRIVVRHETGGVGASGGPEMTDVVGHVRAMDETSVTIEQRDGLVRVVTLRSVVTWKPVPPRPVRRRRATAIDPEKLTGIMSRGWPAIESVQLGEWELRAAGGFTGRANSAAATGSPGIAFAEAAARVRTFYAERAMPALVHVVVGSSQERQFTEIGWSPKEGYRGGALVQVTDLAASYDSDPAARIRSVADDDWLSGYGRVDDAAAARAVMQAPANVGFVTIGTPAQAIGRVVVTGEWAGLSAVEVRPAARRQGLARRIVETSLAWAVAHGADKAYLQTMRGNEAALALYRPYGFVDHHDYRYLEPRPHR